MAAGDARGGARTFVSFKPERCVLVTFHHRLSEKSLDLTLSPECLRIILLGNALLITAEAKRILQADPAGRHSGR